MPSLEGRRNLRASKTLARAIDVLEALRHGPLDLKALQASVGMTRSTTHRLAQLLTERNLVMLESRQYRLGPRLLYLAARSQERRDLIAVATPTMAALAAQTHDAVNLAIRDGDEIIYVAQSPSSRRVAVRHEVGDRNVIASTALGRALMFDASAETWTELFPGEAQADLFAQGYALHHEDDADSIRCVAAPIRDVSGAIVAALSLSSISQYMDAARMERLAPKVLEAARTISVELGFFS